MDLLLADFADDTAGFDVAVHGLAHSRIVIVAPPRTFHFLREQLYRFHLFFDFLFLKVHYHCHPLNEVEIYFGKVNALLELMKGYWLVLIR